MAGDDIDYSHPANYGKMVALLEKLRDYYGVKGRPVDALFINTLLAFTHENIKNAFRKDHPEMKIRKMIASGELVTLPGTIPRATHQKDSRSCFLQESPSNDIL
jgi:hypothetical protein